MNSFKLIMLKSLVIGFLLPHCSLNAQSFTVSIEIANGISCHGASDGSLAAVVNPPGSAYTFLWSNGQTTQAVTNLNAGAYSVQVQNAAGGAATATFILAQPEVLTLQAMTTLPAEATPLGNVDVATSGGTAPYSYQWINESGVPFSNQEDLIDAPAGVYTQTALDQHGCAAQLSPVTLLLVSSLDEAASTSFRAYPNPVSDVLMLESTAGEAVACRIVDASGKLIYSAFLPGGQTAVNTNSWPAGHYVVLMAGEHGITSQKVLVQHF